MAITALLAGFILSYSSSSRDQVILYVEQAKFAQTVARAKSLTISTFAEPTIPCGYGVRVNYPTGNSSDDTYTLFSYDAPQCSGITSLDPSSEVEVVTEILPTSLTFGTPDVESVEVILFRPPNPDTWIWRSGDVGTSTQGHVILQSKSGSFSVPVELSSAGQITF